MSGIRKILTFVFLCISVLEQYAVCQSNNDMMEFIKQKFLKYTKEVPREEIYLHSDRDTYISGEELWFNIYLIDRESLKPSLNSKIAYFELLNAVNRPVVQKRIIIDNGLGPGGIHLPDTLSSGTYTIRAYTNWMKNFMPYNCFTKDIRIYNSFSKKVISAKHEVNNLNCVTRDNHLKISSIQSSRDSLEIVFYSKNTGQNLDNGNYCYLFVETHGIINYLSSEKIRDGIMKTYVAKNELIPGINHFTVFDLDGKPVSESYIYTPGQLDSINLIAADSVMRRSKVSLILNAKDKLPASSSNYSISVVPKSSSGENINMDFYLVFGTEFGLPDWKVSELSKLKPDSISSSLKGIKSNWIDWNIILSDKLPHFKYGIESEEHFLYGKISELSGNEDDKKWFVIMCRPGKEADFQYAIADSSGNFSFGLQINNDLNDLIFIPQDRQNQKIILESPFYDQYPLTQIDDGVLNPDGSEENSILSFDYQVGKIYGIHSFHEPVAPDSIPPIAVKFYGKPDIELVLADYVSLPRMEEVFFELLPRVYMKKKKSGYEISIADRIVDNRYELSPALFIDGVLIRDASLIADLDPELVEKIEVIKEKYYLGRYKFDGLINVITKAGNFSNITLPEYMTRIHYRVADASVSFFSPDYSSSVMKESSLPDFRNTLFWDPSVKPDSDGKIKIDFWTSDVAYDYEIKVQGITSDGKIIAAGKFLKVK